LLRDMKGLVDQHVKVGSVIVREYQGKLHEVLVVPGGLAGTGFCEPVDHRPQDHRNQLERAPLLRLAWRRGGAGCRRGGSRATVGRYEARLPE
jgi:hypothetical protein